jgi:hypothetical protein
MASSRSFEPLARRVCKAVLMLMGDKRSQWVSVVSVAKAINVSDDELIEGAVQRCKREGWLMIGGDPVHSVLLTPKGEQIAENIRWQPTTVRGMSKNVVSSAVMKSRAKIK